jgi:hypothetical protein
MNNLNQVWLQLVVDVPWWNIVDGISLSMRMHETKFSPQTRKKLVKLQNKLGEIAAEIQSTVEASITYYNNHPEQRP